MQRIVTFLGQSIVLLLLVVLLVHPGRLPPPRKANQPGQPIVLGAYIAHAPYHPAELDTFTRLVGQTPAVVMWYQDWVHTKQFNPTWLNAVVKRQAMPMVTWEPWDSEGAVEQPAFALRTIIVGQHDSYIRAWARAAARWGKPFYLRFAHEMNGIWYPWAVGVNGNTSAEYVQAWRHVVAIFRAEGATNVRWVWSPNIAYWGTTPFAEVYPGDAEVDWVALDGYNVGTTQSNGRWKSLVEIFEDSYITVVAMTSKPLMIAETASVEQGGDKAAWIAQGFLSDLPSRLPQVRAVIWFDEDKQADWRVDSSEAALVAYKRIAMSKLYQAQLP